MPPRELIWLFFNYAVSPFGAALSCFFPIQCQIPALLTFVLKEFVSKLLDILMTQINALVPSFPSLVKSRADCIPLLYVLQLMHFEVISRTRMCFVTLRAVFLLPSGFTFF